MPRYLILSAALALAACAPDAWVRPGTPPTIAAAQEYNCRIQAKIANPSRPNDPIGFAAGIDRAFDFNACMQAHGFMRLR